MGLRQLLVNFLIRFQRPKTDLYDYHPAPPTRVTFIPEDPGAGLRRGSTLRRDRAMLMSEIYILIAEGGIKNSDAGRSCPPSLRYMVLALDSSSPNREDDNAPAEIHV